MQGAELGTTVDPPLPQSVKRREYTAARTAAPEPLQEAVHASASAVPELRGMQQPAIGHPVVLWQPRMAVVAQWQPTLAVAGLPQAGNQVLLLCDSLVSPFTIQLAMQSGAGAEASLI